MNRRSCLLLLLLALSAASPAWAAGEVYKWTDEKGVVHYGDAPPEGSAATKVAVREIRAADEPAAPAEAAKPEEKPAAPTAQSNCDIAKRNLETLVKAPRVEMDNDGDGKPEPLSDEQRAAEQSRNEDLVRIYCGE